jgi:hypothetical protein
MLSLDQFELQGTYVDAVLEKFGETLVGLINIASQVNKIEINNLIFKSGTLFDQKAKLTLKDLINHRIPIFDYLIYKSLSEDPTTKITWVVDTTRKNYTESQISFSVLFIYFMLVTRNKAIPEGQESIPNFLMKFMLTPMTIDDIKNCLSYNDLNQFQHNWIKEVDISRLSSAIKNRFKQGIAGMRLFAVFRDNEVDRDIDANTENLVKRVKKLATEGPFWEMHNLFQLNELSSISINANLTNLLLDCFSEEKIKLLLKEKSIFKYPVYNNRALSYKTWSDSFFNLFIDRLKF